MIYRLVMTESENFRNIVNNIIKQKTPQKCNTSMYILLVPKKWVQSLRNKLYFKFNYTFFHKYLKEQRIINENNKPGVYKQSSGELKYAEHLSTGYLSSNESFKILLIENKVLKLNFL